MGLDSSGLNSLVLNLWVWNFAKVGLRSSAIVKDSDAYYFSNYCSSYTSSSKVKIQSFNIKKSKFKESKPKKIKLINAKTPILPLINESAKPNY